MRKLILTTTALVSLSVGFASANALAEKAVQDLQALGYTSIEVEVGPTQLRVEAYQPGTKIEIVQDLATGAVLKQETETLDPTEPDDDYTPGVEIEDVAQDFLDSEGRIISDDEAYNDPLANQVTDDLAARGYTTVETLIGPTQVRSVGYRVTGDVIEVVYDRATGAVIRETTTTGQPNDDDYVPSTLIEDVPFDFLDDEGNVIVPDDEDDIDDIAEIDDELEVDDDGLVTEDDEDDPTVENDDDEANDDRESEDEGNDDHDSDGEDGGDDGGDGDSGESESGED